ncbi:MAG: endonuclease/exonuclease/phosphatase family protein [Actinomycetota bacterium]|nr:endonuclease/exonuclease/phosphatase family protein [Actinomycetota bacterium]
MKGDLVMDAMSATGQRRFVRAGLALLVAALGVSLLPGLAEAAKGKKNERAKDQVVRVMTRNVYLGADLGPGLTAPDLPSFIDATGVISDQVERTNFPLRAQALALEIIRQRPDVVGLQEVALWRTGPVVLGGAPSASTDRYDFLDLLLAELNKGQKPKCKVTGKGRARARSKATSKRYPCADRYRAVVVKEEFDFESPVNDGGGGLGAATRNERLTMRDVILARVGTGVKTSQPASGTFPVLMRVSVGGVASVNVTRGWTAADVRVRKAEPFHFVNLHFEAFDSHPTTNNTNIGTIVGQGQIRQAQAQSLLAPGGAARSKLPVVLLGDLNSDDDTVGLDGDVLAYNALAAGGFRPVDTSNPLSCCLGDPNLVAGSLADFDHHIDHVLTSSPKRVKFRKGFVTGRVPVDGLWPSDHNGVTSVLKLPASKGTNKK